MSRPSKDLRDLAGLYALDALDPDQTREFEAFMATSPETRREVDEFRAAAANLAAAEAVTPSSSLHDAVMSEVAVTRQVSPAVVSLTGRRRSGVLAVAAALLVVVSLGLLVVSLGGEGSDEVTAVLESPDAVTVQLDGPDTPNLRIVWSADLDQLAVVPGETPVLDDGVYALWSLPSAGDPQLLVAFDATDTVLVDTTSVAEPNALAVSVEVDGDVTTPTEPVVAGPVPVDL